MIRTALPSMNEIRRAGPRGDTADTNRIALFLDAMDTIIPWPVVIGIVKHYCLDEPRLNRDHIVRPLARYFVIQRWFGTPLDELDELINDSTALQGFVGPEDYSTHETVKHGLKFLSNVAERTDLIGELEGVVESALAASRLSLHKGCFRLPELQAQGPSRELAALSRYFTSIKPPYTLDQIYRFNAIYKPLYTQLSVIERQQSEAYVDCLIAGLERPEDASKIFGVV